MALNAEIKAYIVQALACFDPPSKVAEAVRDKFGVAVSRQSVETYDPTKRAGRDLAKRWVEMFDEARAKFQAATVDIPVANRAYRLRVLQRLLDRAEERGNLVGALKLMEQAAKECGDVYVARPVAAPVPAATRVEVDYLLAEAIPGSFHQAGSH
jgi:hypothetical protein